MRGDKGGARLAGGSSGAGGGPAAPAGRRRPGRGPAGGERPRSRRAGAGFWRGGRRLGLGNSREEKRGRQAWGSGSENDRRIKGRKGLEGRREASLGGRNQVERKVLRKPGKE